MGFNVRLSSPIIVVAADLVRAVAFAVWAEPGRLSCVIAELDAQCIQRLHDIRSLDTAALRR
jgi:hypothetical protein